MVSVNHWFIVSTRGNQAVLKNLFWIAEQFSFLIQLGAANVS